MGELRLTGDDVCKNEIYSMSFTTGGLFLQEAPRAVELYLDIKDWGKVRKIILENNILQQRTKSSCMRISRELCDRLSQLQDDELKLVAAGDTQDQAALLWLAVCRQYRFIYEFAVEVLRGKVLMHQQNLSYADFNAFFNAKAAWHEEIDKVKDSTLAKLRQVLFRIMREAGFLNTGGIIQLFTLSNRVIFVVAKRCPVDMSVFPIANISCRECVQ